MSQKTLMISYDLGVPEDFTDYTKVTDYIKSFDSWAKPLQSQWLVKTTRTTSDVRDALKNITDSNDKILVVDVTGDKWATSHISSKVTDWMKKNI